jgi:hypothetical protein
MIPGNGARTSRTSGTLLWLGALCLIASSSHALEVYSGREFPPLSSIKATYEAYDSSRRTFDIVLGKVKLNEAADTYRLYYQWKSGGEVRQDSDVKLVMLDTNIWIMYIANQKFVVVLK